MSKHRKYINTQDYARKVQKYNKKLKEVWNKINNKGN